MIRLCIFVLLLLGPLAAGELYVRSLPDPAKSKHAYLSRHSNEVDILILGSSHTYYGICPQLLSPRAYSAAQVSQTWKYDDWILRHYSFRGLRRVILPVSDFSFYEELEDGDEWYLANRYRLYMDCDLHPRGSVYDWEVTAFRPFCEKLKSLWLPPRRAWSPQGQGLEYTLKRRPKTWDNGAERAAHNTYTDYVPRALVNERYLRDMAAYCRANQVSLWLLSTPLSVAYRAHQHPAQLRDTRRRLARFLAEYPEVRYLDYRADSAFHSDDFYDADHLNTHGARKLSGLLRRQM